VLNSIAAQHGLLVERARGIYSFSHLTFQEYFTARWFKEKADVDFGALISHVTDKQWREVFLLTVGMLKSVDKLVLGMKREIDGLLAQDEKLQEFLGWVVQKSCTTKSRYKVAAVRAYYITLASTRASARARARNLALARAFDLDLDLVRNLARARDLARDLAIALDRDLALDLAIARDLALDLDRDLDRDLARAIAIAIAIDRDLSIACVLARSIARAIALVTELPDLQKSLLQLKDRLPNFSSENHDNFARWWQANGRDWAEELRSITIEHRNIGHDWQFSKAQKNLLQQYYDVNKLLVDCLNSDCYVSREVRAEIEASLLLPIKSLS
jgi:predicted NACHT family NTPase